jgi:hypothetical protein
MDRDTLNPSRLRIGTIQAIRRYPILAILPVFFFVAAGVAIGLGRAPTYTATAEVSVGRISTTTPTGIPGVIEASRALASTYARAIDASAVVNAAAKSVNRPPGAIKATVNATPIPESPLIKVTATGATTGEAVRTANAASKALIDYVGRLNRTESELERVATRFRVAAFEYSRRQDVLDRLQRSADNGSTSARDGLVKARAELSSARLERDSLQATYTTLQQSGTAAPTLEVFSLADGAESDRAETVQILGLIGLIAGLLAGAGLATVRANRRFTRMLPT